MADAGHGSGLIGRLLPPGSAAAETFADLPGGALFPAEQASLGAASAERRAEFATGRACARSVLARLGQPAAPLLAGAYGEPRWPAGITGSITHCAGYRACAAARLEDVAALGIDAEPDLPLPDGLLAEIARPAERGWVADHLVGRPAASWDRLLFCAKESAYKAWFPLAGQPFRLRDTEVAPGPGRAFSVRPPALSARGSRALPELHGRWLSAAGLLLAAAAAW